MISTIDYFIGLSQGLHFLRISGKMDAWASEYKNLGLQRIQAATAGTNFELFADVITECVGDPGLDVASDTSERATPRVKKPRLSLDDLEGNFLCIKLS